MAAYYTFEDLSGANSNGTKTDNPYHDLIESCNDKSTKIQERYSNHRVNRNAQQKEKLLAKDFPGVTIDEILMKLETPDKYPGYEDPRHCLVFWARPTADVKKLIAEVQRRLREAVPNLWIMPQDSLHMTALEITHSLTAPEIDALVDQLKPQAEAITDYTLKHHPRLVRPTVSFDAQALALSWLPATGQEGDDYTYHHLRRDLFTITSKTGVTVASRYVIPSAHLTIGRFITKEDTPDGDHGAIARLVQSIEEINACLQDCEYEWTVGEEKGLDLRKGTLWYGSGGETIRLGFSKVRYGPVLPDPDLSGMRFHTVAFVETYADGLGHIHHVTGDLVSRMRYERARASKPELDNTRQYHSKKLLGMTLKSDDPAPSLKYEKDFFRHQVKKLSIPKQCAQNL
ncbi:hypothetical protein AC579_8184 [Pseudocercospora musae]|uniref:Uncharacterized protein n=1 Tax=Pseudocercospora musae TaxID=113226 RepID=A0A139IUU1_9PEZI|nr:hypothetical protein AC579_8184 [Pseudocercospora musae]